MRTYLNDNWDYFSQWTDDIFTRDDGTKVRLPHTNVETPFNCFDESIYQFVSGYRKTFHIDKVTGKFLLTFEGVAQESTLYINGEEVKRHCCGYTAFTVDITEKLLPGNNQIVVKVDSRESVNQPPFGYVIDYLTYGGIYREVYLEHFDGCYVSNAFVKALPEQPLTVDVTFGGVSGKNNLRAEILEGDDVLYTFNYQVDTDKFTFSEKMALKLWDIEHPQLYTLKLTICGNEYKTTFGVRKAQFTKDGFFLNGKRIKIVGLNRHQSFPYVGYAMPESMQRRDADILKNTLCVNTVRTSHYPQSHYFVDQCDKLGLLVFMEIPGWQHIGDNAWKAQAIRNVEDMITQYRNHPSIVIWGVRINESADCDFMYEKTNALAHLLDPTRQTGGVRNFTHSHLLEDVYTFNDFNRDGATDRKNVCDPNVPYLVTEYNGHMFPTKNYDDFPHKRHHVLKYSRMLNGVFGDVHTCGAIGWCMFDYNTHKDFGSGDRICYHGVTDMFRNPKMAAGVFSSLGKAPFLDVCFTTDIGDYPEGNVGELYCLTNAEYVDVYKGDLFVKRYSHKDTPFKNIPNAPILINDMIGNLLTEQEGIAPKYAKLVKEVMEEIWNASSLQQFSLSVKLKILKIMKGTKLSLDQLVAIHNKYRNNWGNAATALTLKAYNGKTLVAQKTVGTANSFKIQLDVSSRKLHENTTYDVAAVNVKVVDQNGNNVPYTTQIVHFRTEGAVQLVGPSEIALVGGMGGTYVKTTGQKGKGRLFVENEVVEFDVD